MKAVFKNKLAIKFDRAIKDAKDSNCEIICFKLESEEENRLIHSYYALSEGGVIDPSESFEYEGILIHEFIPATDRN